MSGENEVFKAGNEIPIFDIDGTKVSIAVCYDIRFPELIRAVSLNDISMIFSPGSASANTSPQGSMIAEYPKLLAATLSLPMTKVREF